MAILTEVRFAHEDGALAHTLSARRDLEIRVIREASTDPKQSVYLLRLAGGTETDVRAVLESDSSVESITPMDGFADQQLWRIQFADDVELLAPRVSNADGFVLDARSERPGNANRGWHERWLLPDREALHGIWQEARDSGFDFEVLDFRRQYGGGPEYFGADAPTTEQRVALVTAFEHGYFAEPRATSLEELADVLELSPTAVAGRLKRGMKSLIGMTIVVDEGYE